MHKRCYNKTCGHFNNYGGRGIYICDEWLHHTEAFVYWSLAHGYAAGLSIDRIDVNGPYSPQNCRWATKQEQVRNTRHVRNITFNGETHPLSEWARKIGIERATLVARFRSGWTIDRALTVPAFLGRNQYA